MRILKWSSSQPAGYRFDCPKWIRDGFAAGTLNGYICVDEAEACVAAYLAFYLSEEAAEVVAHGVTEGYDPAFALGRLYRRLRQHCREWEIARIEEKIVGQIPEEIEHILLREDFFALEESVGQVWVWIDRAMDQISFHDAELEADMALADSMETGGLMLSRLTPFTHMLEAEGEAYDMALDARMLPFVMLSIYCLGAERLMEIGCKLPDIEAGEFIFTVQTVFAGYEDAGEAALLCSRVNERMERATAYWDKRGNIVLRGYAIDDEFSDVIRWRKFLRDWTMDCHVAGMMLQKEDVRAVQ